MAKKGVADATDRAKRARDAMESAFEEAEVLGFEAFIPNCAGFPDPNDAHVAAAALQTRAAVIVTENLKHFPEPLLNGMGLEVRSTDCFLADAIALDPGLAVTAFRTMRWRFRRPGKTAHEFLLDMEANGLTETVDTLRPYSASL